MFISQNMSHFQLTLIHNNWFSSVNWIISMNNIKFNENTKRIMLIMMLNRIESEEIEEEIDVDFDTKSQHASRKGIEENG